MRYSVPRTLNIDLTIHLCEICNKRFKGLRGLKSHKTQMHSGIKDTQHRGRPQGFGAWNKGLTKETDKRIKSPENCLGICLDPIKEKQRRLSISKTQKINGVSGGYRENAGRSKKFKVYDSFGKQTTLQSTFELNCSEILAELGINWIRPKAVKYDKTRNYFADFYLPDYDIWLDPKNDYKAKLDEEKIRKVREQNGIILYILLEYQITKSYISSILL